MASFRSSVLRVRPPPNASAPPKRPPGRQDRRVADQARTIVGGAGERADRSEFRNFLVTIDAAVPVGLGVHVVLDNASTHKRSVIQKWLVEHPRFQFHFTPTSSSWMNLVERWFAELHEHAPTVSSHVGRIAHS